MENILVCTEKPPVATGDKQEMDQSYGKREESGFHSNSSSSDTSNSWDIIKGEIMDISSFDPPINAPLQSSNIEKESQGSSLLCNISTISGDEPRFKGNTSFHSEQNYYKLNARSSARLHQK